MKIKDLPQPIKELALKRQVEQGNEPNADSKLIFKQTFNWEGTVEGYDFWAEIARRNFKPFYDLYPKGVDTSTENVDTSKDEFAIGFAEWVIDTENKPKGEFTIKQLLEIYKKEQGL